MKIQEAIRHYEYGITHDIFKEPVTTYAQLSVEALKKLSVYEQVKWERDIAISQLEEIGCGFGRKMDDVKAALEKQIPKKPKVQETTEKELHKCPCCDGFLMEIIKMKNGFIVIGKIILQKMIEKCFL